MAILADDLWKAMRAILGVAGTQRYLPDQQIIPAINGALRTFNGYVQGVAFAERKGSEELLREITITRIFQTNDMGGVVFDEVALGHKVWSINAVYPEPLTNPTNATISGIPVEQSEWRSDVALRRPGKYRCTRITLEQVPDSEMSRFMPGSEKMANAPLKSYAYYLIGDRTTTNWIPDGTELVVLPASITGRRLIGISYMKGVDPITSLNSFIPYPSSAFQLLRNMALNELAIRQGSTPLYNVTEKNIRELMQSQA